MSGDTKSSPSKSISLGACPSADVNSPPFTIESSVLSSVGVNTPSSSNGINSTNAFSSGVSLMLNVAVEPSPLITSESFLLVLSSCVR